MSDLPPVLIPPETVVEPLDSLAHHPENARQSNIGEIVESIKANGVFRALRCQTSTRYIVAGNGEYDALKILGYETAPVQWLDVSDALALDILIADNGTSDDATYDETAHAELLTRLAQTREGGLLGLGWSAERYEDLLRVVAAPDLGDLAHQLGDPNEAALWPRIIVAAPPELVERFKAVLARMPGATPHDQLSALLDRVPL
jgi:ParB-like chromosome segregation protein Spo0J